MSVVEAPTVEFVGFPKMARYSRKVIVTEKLDGTNACLYIGEDGEFLTGSRKQWITPEQNDFGFSRWAHEHRDELMQMGPGRHFGEWWGSGIYRGYGLAKGEKRFSLFNVIRWCLHGEAAKQISPRRVKRQDVLPACVGLVPVLWQGQFDVLDVEGILWWLSRDGSRAAPGFMRPEGIVIYHVAGNVGFKKTLENDMPKGRAGKAVLG